MKNCVMSVNSVGTVGASWETLVVPSTLVFFAPFKMSEGLHAVHQNFSYSSGHPPHSGDQSSPLYVAHLPQTGTVCWLLLLARNGSSCNL